jgi:hypothetical protein
VPGWSTLPAPRPPGDAVVFLVAVVLVSALAVPLLGGRLGALVEVHLRHIWAIFAALALEIAAIGLPGAARWAARRPAGGRLPDPGGVPSRQPAPSRDAAGRARGADEPAGHQRQRRGHAGVAVGAGRGGPAGGRARVSQLGGLGRSSAGVPRRRLLYPGLLAAQQHLQRRGRADRPRGGLGAAPCLPVPADPSWARPS